MQHATSSKRGCVMRSPSTPAHTPRHTYTSTHRHLHVQFQSQSQPRPLRARARHCPYRQVDRTYPTYLATPQHAATRRNATQRTPAPGCAARTDGCFARSIARLPTWQHRPTAQAQTAAASKRPASAQLRAAMAVAVLRSGDGSGGGGDGWGHTYLPR
jgi:hypothetical protein